PGGDGCSPMPTCRLRGSTCRNGRPPRPDAMALPPRLQRYDRLIDYLVEGLVRETQDGTPQKATPPDRGNGGGVCSRSKLKDGPNDGNSRTAGDPAATALTATPTPDPAPDS